MTINLNNYQPEINAKRAFLKGKSNITYTARGKYQIDDAVLFTLYDLDLFDEYTRIEFDDGEIIDLYEFENRR